MKALTIPIEEDELAALEKLAAHLGFSDLHDYISYLTRRSLKATERQLDNFLYDGLFERAHEAAEAEIEALGLAEKPGLRLL